MEIFKIVSGPILGTIIGFGTNYLAIKMLFRPHKPIKLFGKTLPFTPGIIPKRKNDIAEAIGDAVGNKLFTKDDIQKMLLSEKNEEYIYNSIMRTLQDNDDTIKENLVRIVKDEEYENIVKHIEEYITVKIQNAILGINISDIIVNEGGKAIKEEIHNPLVKIFLSDNMIENFSIPIGNKIENYIQTVGKDLIKNEVEKEIKSIEETKLANFIQNINLNEEKIKMIVSIVYKNSITNVIDIVFENFDITTVVKEKINNMSVEELEKMILKIMKKELNAIVTLGGILGFLIGLINIVFVL